MTLEAVHIDADVLFQFMTYALCFEKEEVCSILLGVAPTPTSAHVTGTFFALRRDKRRDRVEIHPEQLSEAMVVAESQGKGVIGWAHSHPNITVFPSHVDLATQLNLQKYTDPNFFGLVLSCFDGGKETQKLQVICFQTIQAYDEPPKQLEIPLIILPSPNLSESALLPLATHIINMLYKEEKDGYSNAIQSDAGSVPINSTVYTQHLVQLMDRLGGPILAFLNDRHERNLREIAQYSRSG
ncbi:lys-63-specific deubiquitinase BRCC36-like protein [Cladochytrium replicatum]|nr:lys-63-specific deubiquitinase BRCC36-like protein [Cladochytrium replicatum]